jgi:disulfide bond formation protein DsbB
VETGQEVQTLLDWLSLRLWYLLVAVAVLCLLLAGLYFQHVMFLEPCPLCIFQRVAFMWIGGAALLGALFYPGPVGRWVFSSLVIIGSAVGAGLAGRHIYLQNLPPDQVPDCGPGLSYMVDTLPFQEVLAKVLSGDGECANIKWSFLG